MTVSTSALNFLPPDLMMICMHCIMTDDLKTWCVLIANESANTRAGDWGL